MPKAVAVRNASLSLYVNLTLNDAVPQTESFTCRSRLLPDVVIMLSLLELCGQPSIFIHLFSFLMVCSIIRVDPALCHSPDICSRVQYTQWSRWITLGRGRCFQAHNFADLSNDCATFRFTHLLPKVSQSILQLSRQSRTMTRTQCKWFMRLRISRSSTIDMRCSHQHLALHTCWCRLPEVTLTHAATDNCF